MGKRGPAAKGEWCGPYKKFRRCGRCSVCLGSKSARPHGPYYIMSRRNPKTGKHEDVSFGHAIPTQEQIDFLNKHFITMHRPTKEEVIYMKIIDMRL